MTTIIIESVRFTVSAAVAASYVQEHENAQKMRERMANYHAQKRELQAAFAAGDWDYYSDLHKDLYGVRP